MAQVPFCCRICGHTFFAPNISFSGLTVVGLHGFSTRCERCGGAADGLEGTFEFGSDTFAVQSAPAKTHSLLAALNQSLAVARKNAAIEDIIEPLKAASPELAAVALSAANKGGAVFLVAMLIYLLSQCSQNTQGTVNWNQMLDQAHVYVTGSEPYPGLGQNFEPQATGTAETGQPSRPERKSGPSRQQRRQTERQAKKHLPKGEQHPSGTKPRGPKH